jgi:hypothetical protein
MERPQPETSETCIPSDASLVRQGFLLEGQTLEQISRRDEEALKILGYTAKEVADLIAPLCELCSLHSWKTFHYTASNGKEFNVRIERFRGIKLCPWDGRVDLKHSPSSVNLHITEIGKTETVMIAGLLRHLIDKHGFFEGGAYRVAPELIVEMFGKEKEGHEGSIERAKSLSL